jgi:hypothetical protein
VAITPAEPGAAPTDEPACPRCGARYTGDQEYCLECGFRLPAASGVTGALSTAWRRRVGGYPGDWVWPVLLGLVVAIVAAVAAVLLSRSDGRGSTIVATTGGSVAPPTVVGTSETVPATPTDTTVVTPPVTGTAPPPTTTGTVPPPRPRPRRPIAWPAGQSGWTVVLESIPRTDAGRQLASARARQAIRGALPQVGILDSNRFSSLHPGYYVVFAGVHDDKSGADASLSRARAAGFAAAYSRRIVP